MTKLIRRTPGKSANDSAEPAASPGKALPSPRYPFLLPPIEDDEIGRLGNYRVLRLLGRGGMGLVFHAEDLTLRRPVALKVMKPDQDGEMSGWQRFLREARLMAAIKHESLVTVYQAGQENGAIYLAMELLEGASLQEWSERVPDPPLADVVRISREIAVGLAVIHKRGLIHRDLKPANLWLEAPDNRVKVLDFGLARFIEDDVGLTQQGTVLGTPSFMSPEQARGEVLDARSDLFSFGCVLYTLCTGMPPFPGDTTAAVLLGLTLKEPRPVRQLNPTVPQALSDLIAELLAKSPEDRPPSAEAVLERLRGLNVQPANLSTRPPPAAPRARPRNSSRTRKKTKVAAAARRRWRKVGLVVGLLVGFAFIAGGLTAAAFAARRAFPSLASAGPTVTPQTGSQAQGTAFLSDLSPVQREHWPFLPPSRPGAPPIRPIGGVLVRGKLSSHGIFMHPPPAHEGPASLTYRLQKQYRTFQTEIALNDGPAPAGDAATFSVYGDGRLLWRSRPVRGQEDAQTCSVSVAGVDELKIEVACEDEPRGLHAVWIEPSLAK